MSSKDTKNLKLVLENQLDAFQGNHNQIKLATAAGFDNLSHLFNTVKYLGFSDILGYKRIHVSIETANQVAKNFSDGKITKDTITPNIILETSKIFNLDKNTTFRLIQNIFNTEELPFSTNTVDRVKYELQDNYEQYIGNNNQYNLCKAVNCGHFSYLYDHVVSLGYLDKLKYNRMYLSLKQFELLKKLLEDTQNDLNLETVKVLAKKIGINNFRELYEPIKALGKGDMLDTGEDVYSNMLRNKDTILQEYHGNDNQYKLACEYGFGKNKQTVYFYNILDKLGIRKALGYNKFPVGLPIEALGFIQERFGNHIGDIDEIFIENITHKFPELSYSIIIETLEVLVDKKKLHISPNLFIKLPFTVLSIADRIKIIFKNKGYGGYQGIDGFLKLSDILPSKDFQSINRIIKELGYINKIKYPFIPLVNADHISQIITYVKSHPNFLVHDNYINDLQLLTGIKDINIIKKVLWRIGYKEEIIGEHEEIKIKLSKLQKHGKLLQYQGNLQQIALAEALGITSLGKLTQILGELGFLKQMGYNKIELNVEQYKQVLTILQTGDIDNFESFYEIMQFQYGPYFKENFARILSLLIFEEGISCNPKLAKDVQRRRKGHRGLFQSSFNLTKISNIIQGETSKEIKRRNILGKLVLIVSQLPIDLQKKAASLYLILDKEKKFVGNKEKFKLYMIEEFNTIVLKNYVVSSEEYLSILQKIENIISHSDIYKGEIIDSINKHENFEFGLLEQSLLKTYAKNSFQYLDSKKKIGVVKFGRNPGWYHDTIIDNYSERNYPEDIIIHQENEEIQTTINTLIKSHLPEEIYNNLIEIGDITPALLILQSQEDIMKELKLLYKKLVL